MAFSYSDKNFTVIGNLCFVHIFVKNKNEIYDIPPAIADRMLIKELACPYITYNDENFERNSNVGIVRVSSGSISYIGQYNNGYLMFYFPIDSNK